MSPASVASAQHQAPRGFGDEISSRLLKPRKKLPQNFRTSSLDRGQRSYYMDWRADRARKICRRVPTPDLISDHSSTTYCGTGWPDWSLENEKFFVKESLTPPDPDLPDTDPQVVHELWRIVTMDIRSMSEGHGMTLRSKAASSREGKESAKDVDGKSTASAAKPKNASPYDQDFREQVLTPRGIFIVEDSEELCKPVWRHFATEEPEGDRQAFYRLKGSEHSSVWLDNNQDFAERIVNEYHCMEEDNMCEAEFASYARTELFRKDPRVSLQHRSKNRVWTTDRMLEMVAKAKGGRWEAPPVLGSQQQLKPYNFDIRPDCAYWLSLQAFNEGYVSQVGRWAFVMKQRRTCPYLFIEFKRDDAESTSAENQVAAAGSLALYNRFKLRKACIEKVKKPFTKDTLHDCKIYGITFGGTFCTVWCIHPALDEATSQWQGCTMTSVWEGYCTRKFDVADLADWINEIHRWGLSVHGPLCENDIKTCLVAHSGGSRVSDVNENLH